MLHALQNSLPLDNFTADFSPITWFPSVQAWAEVDGLALILLLAFIYPGLIFPYGPIETMTCSLDFEQGLLTNLPS